MVYFRARTNEMPTRMDKNIRDIKGYENLYGITTMGKVWSYPKYNGNGKRKGHWLNIYKKAGIV